MTNPIADVELPGIYIDAIALDAPEERINVYSRIPEPGEEGVALDSPISFYIVDVLNPGAGLLSTSITVYVNGVLARDSAGFKSGFDGPGSFLSAQTAGRYVLNIDKTFAFESMQIVSVRITAETTDGLASYDASYSFACIDATAPKLTAAQAIGHRAIRIVFDESVRAVSSASTDDALNPSNYVLAPLVAPAIAPAVLSVAQESGPVYVLTLATDLTPDATYRLSVAGVADLPGNFIVAPFNSATFFGYACPVPAGRSFDLFAFLPEKNQAEDIAGTGDLRRFLTCLQEPTDLLLCDIDSFGSILDPDFAPEAFVDAMLVDLGNPFSFELSLTDKRRLVRVLVALHKQKGTEVGIRNAVRFFLGFEITIGAFEGTGFSLGDAELGEDWELGASNAFNRFSFEVIVERMLTDTERERLRAVVMYMKRVGTHLINIVEPVAPIVFDHVELGYSELGDTFILH